MVMSSSKPILIPETVLILKDRLKHGQNVARILESQVDTAQQNIVLLQGQVRLANETISNLKKHFQETENILTKLFEPEEGNCTYESVAKEVANEAHMKVADHASPRDSGTESNKSFDGKGESNKSPYAQQLRQVLDVLQDEEPIKRCGVHVDASGNKDCACLDCQPTQKHFDCNSSCTSERDNRPEESCKSKHKINGHANSRDVSPKSSHSIHTSYPPGHCTASCCSSAETSYKGCSSTETPYKVIETPYKVVEKNSQPVHYVSVHSPPQMGEKRPEHHQSGHCGDKCHTSYVNYVPYGYHVMESSPGIPESIQPISPSARRKRAYVPHMADEEPPHLKYTKVKRIDGSKLIAQKTLQDFTKRRFFAYNPRYDLDLLIVPPPISAFELFKNNKGGVAKMPSTQLNMEGYIPESQRHGSSTERRENINGGDTLDNHAGSNYDDDDNVDGQIPGITDNGVDALNATIICNNNESEFNDGNYNSSVNNTPYVHTMFKSPSSNVKLLPAIKEEEVDGQKKLENQIAMMRAEPPVRHVSALNQENNYSLSMKQERTMSPITVGSNNRM